MQDKFVKNMNLRYVIPWPTCRMNNPEPLRKALAEQNMSLADLARSLKISYRGVQKWFENGHIPDDRLKQCYQLLRRDMYRDYPDMYPDILNEPEAPYGMTNQLLKVRLEAERRLNMQLVSENIYLKDLIDQQKRTILRYESGEKGNDVSK